MKLLVLDDEAAVASIVAMIAEQGGWESRHCSSAAAARAILSDEKIDVLMLDYFMPDLNGLEFIQELRAQNVQMPAIIFSGNTYAIDREAAKGLGVMSILQKPLSARELRLSLAEAGKVVAAQTAT